MRIGDNGSSGFSSAGGPGGSDRARIFRNRHRVGERVRGRVLRWERPGLAWVDIQGQELLARLESAPEPGQMLAFLVAQLYPDILLRELSGGSPGSGGAGAPATLDGAVHAFWTARSLFESSARSLPRPDPGLAPEARRKALHAALNGSPKTLGRYLALLDAVAMVNAFLGHRGTGRLGYPAWLLPREAMAVEMLSRGGKDGMAEAVLSFALPRAGQCLARVMVDRDPATGRLTGSCRAAMERPALARAMDAALDGMLGGMLGGLVAPGMAMERMATAPLPPEHRAGVLAGLLRPDGPGEPGFAARV